MTAEALALKLDKCVHLRGDVFRRMISSGREEMSAAPSEEAVRQLHLRYRLTAEAAKTYFDGGFSVVVQDNYYGEALPRMLRLLQGYPVEAVVLCPSLAARIPLRDARSILDIGCGPGNSTAAVAARYPGARVLGVDSSENMVAAACAAHPEFEFRVCEAPQGLDALGGGFDIVFSNACLQWIPEHRTLLPALMRQLRPGGVLAVQIPVQQSQPMHRIIAETARREKWRTAFPAPPRAFHNLQQNEYFDVLGEMTQEFTMWEITYYHRMPSHAAMLEWYRATGMRPYLDKLNKAQQEEFERDVSAQLVQAYPAQRSGEIIFRFPRLFFTAVRPGA